MTLALLMLLSASPAKPVEVASLEREACFGECPIYKVRVFSDGTVKWDGKQFVKAVGAKDAKLSEEQLAQVRAAFDDAKYFELKGSYDCTEITDLPTVTTSYNDGKRSRVIKHYHGCLKSGVEVLRTLETRLDEILNTAQWIK